MARNWIVNGFTQEAWKAIKETIRSCDFSTSFSDYFGAIMCGAVCFDIVLREVGDNKNIEWLLCADPYILGIDSGYGYTREHQVPYDEHDGFAFEFYKHAPFEDTLRNFIEQVDEFTAKDATLSMHADRKDLTWKNDGDMQWT